MTHLNTAIEQFESFIAEKRYQNKLEFDNFLQKLRLEIESLEPYFSREEILKLIKGIRVACAESPFVLRSQQWPRGYQGDFEMIDYIIKGQNRAKEGSFAYYYEDYLLNSDICKQHTNKVIRQAELIKEAIASKTEVKVLSIGCGTSADIRMCIEDIRCSDCEITLVDVDKDAIDFSIKQLIQIKEKITPLHGNIYKLMRNLSEQYDLILIGGVFDYLNDKTIVSILKSIRNNIAEAGKVFFTNIDKNNRYRVFMEYTGDWFLIERSERNLDELIANAEWPEDSYRITKDDTGLTHLVELSYTSNILSPSFAETERSRILLPSKLRAKG